ncbi:uncharacterized protein LOC131434192 [Malaya genurostris]|uniref:uncharacterized protein LOC131434192 n=1 Tax=Malaya genurostris TaxID=325434 RepID=UPI0026F383A1|nr:uncharacterized protein LOC131434192 [Malaya genurostris]
MSEHNVEPEAASSSRKDSEERTFNGEKNQPHIPSCPLCKLLDMRDTVKCNVCATLHNFSCISVTKNVGQNSWRCQTCSVQAAARETDTGKVSGASKQQESIVQPDNGQHKSLSKPTKQERARTISQRVTSMYSRSDKTAKNLIQLEMEQLEAERALQEEEELRKREYLKKKFLLMREMMSETNSISQTDDQSMEKVRSWLDKTNLDHGNMQQPNHTEITCSTSTRINIGQGPSDAHNSNSQWQYGKNETSTPAIEPQLCVLSRAQIAARQSVPKELPHFDGNPEEWPLFYATYTHTTLLCGFSNDENVFRLSKCLKGKALEAVRGQLIHPSNVPSVIRTLKLLFGQPAAIVQTMINRISTFPTLRSDKLDQLIEFAIVVQNLRSTIEASGLQDYLYNVSLLTDLTDKLPASIKLDWAKHQQTLPRITLAEFSSWIYSLAEAASTVTKIGFNETKQVRSSKPSAFINTHSTASELEQPIADTKLLSTGIAAVNLHFTCMICKGTCKSAADCQRFLELTYDSRWTAIKEYGYCKKCLRRHNDQCTARKRCGINGCTYKHHELLHNPSKNSTGSVSNNQVLPVVFAPHNTHRSNSTSVLFRIVPVTLYGIDKTIDTYALLDDGSSQTLLDQEIVDQLHLKGAKNPLWLQRTGGTCRVENNSVTVNFQISEKGQPNRRFNISGARTVSALNLPSQSLNADEMKKQFDYLAGLALPSYSDARPRVLIGADNAFLGNTQKSKERNSHEPVAVKTRLGWTLYGGFSAKENQSDIAQVSLHICSCDELQQAMKNYFSLDSLGISKLNKTLLSTEDERATSLLQSLTNFEGGRYTTGLLWKYDKVNLPDSRALALRRLQCLETRMARDPTLANTIQKKIVDYQRCGYIRKLSDQELDRPFDRIWYLPIFPVANPNKFGKIRIVWDAAATVRGVSLNSVLLKGPDQLSSLTDILYQFRLQRVGLCGDIREMFHQVGIREQDQHCQRFLWRNGDSNVNPDTFVMKVMTFGACCSPSSAQYVKNLNAQRFTSRFPRAVDAIIHKHYVDDLLASVETIEEAVQLAKEIHFIHAQGGFEIRNWLSNSITVLQKMNQHQTEEKNLIFSEEMATEKILGLWWNTSTDCLTFKVNWSRYDSSLLDGSRYPTKRELLRILMSIYDPLGLVANFLGYLKVLLQDVWRSGILWDEPIRCQEFKKWDLWRQALPQVETVSVNRCYRRLISSNKQTNIQMHTFVDASETSFAAVVYLRFEENGYVECTLIGAKTRVAPLKYISIPRLELQAAVIGSRLASSIVSALSIKIDRRYFWTDSRDVMCWLASDHRRYSQFVACRVSEILENTDLAEWSWLSTKENVADEATKWERPPDFSINSRWFSAPKFIKEPTESWAPLRMTLGTTNEELRASVLTHTVLNPVIATENFSRWRRLVRFIACVLRFPNNIKLKLANLPSNTGPYVRAELHAAEKTLYKLAQYTAFGDEIALIAKAEQTKSICQIPKDSALYKLTPRLDAEGLLRLHTRIQRCEYITEEAKNPIILPRNHHITKLLIHDFHERFHHCNHNTVINELKHKFHIPRIRIAYKSTRRECQRCKNEQSKPIPPAMGDLPRARLAAYARPFSFVGIDYFGPLSVVVGKRVEKRWGVLITCMTTRAIHLEIAHTLSTTSCILAIKNFIARRGVPREVHSDRGTNFLGTERELREALAKVDEDMIMKEFISSQLEWKFIPPASPHMGGCWERLVQSVKRNLYALKPQRLPTDEILRNMLAEIENTVNSRPLTHVPIENDDAPALTPNHFILGSSNGSKPDTLCDDSGLALRRAWCSSQVLANVFWKKWLKDYLPEITRRSKWFYNIKPIEIDDIVLIVDPKSPRNCWPKGRVIFVNKSADGQVRWATVQTAHGVYERPAVKLAILDVRCNR